MSLAVCAVPVVQRVMGVTLLCRRHAALCVTRWSRGRPWKYMLSGATDAACRACGVKRSGCGAGHAAPGVTRWSQNQSRNQQEQLGD